MGQMKEIDIEIKNSPVLSYLWHKIKANRKALDDALLQQQPLLNFFDADIYIV